MLFRVGLRHILESQPDMQVVGETGSSIECLSLVTAKQPDIVLLEYDLDNGLNFEIYEQVINACPRAHLILVTASTDRQIYLQAVQHGVLGVVPKTQSPEVLINAIRKVHHGEVWVEHSLIAKLLSNFVQKHVPPAEDAGENEIDQLSEREREIIQYIGRGLKNKQIASLLCIAETTVRHHLTKIYFKLGVSDRLELLIYAQEHKLTNIAQPLK